MNGLSQTDFKSVVDLIDGGDVINNIYYRYGFNLYKTTQTKWSYFFEFTKSSLDKVVGTPLFYS